LVAAMRAEYQRSGGAMSFDTWLDYELTGWINELSASAVGSQALVDAANVYSKPATNYQTVEEVMEAFAGKEHLLINELARQLIQLRESGEMLVQPLRACIVHILTISCSRKATAPINRDW
jgi:hypothetical protein